MLLKTLFHLLGALQFGYGCYYDATYVKIPSSTGTTIPMGGKLKYLTFLNAMMQTAYFTIAFINDIFGNNESTSAEKPLIRKIKDTLFSSIAFPVSMFVGTTFWGIYAVDRELILPRSLDPYFPVWLNHVMHTNILLFSMIEMFTSFRMYPSRKTALSLLCTFMLFYVVWIHVLFFKTGSWVYPILSVLNWPMRVVFYVSMLAFACTLYLFGETLNRAIWSKEVEETLRSGKKKAK